MNRHNVRWLFLLAPAVLWSQTTSGTTGVAIWMHGRAILAIDSRITLTAGDYSSRGHDECKIRAAGRFYIAIAGLNDHAATNFDAWRIAGEAVSGARSVSEAAALAEQRLDPELRTALRNIQASDLAGFSRHYAQGHLAIVVAGLDDGAPAMAACAFVPDANGGLRVVRWATADSLFVFGENRAIGQIYRDPSVLVREAGAVEAARRLVQLEIDREPERVGPPISILQLTRDGASWVQAGRCGMAAVNLSQGR